jgi:hypothetical protein
MFRDEPAIAGRPRRAFAMFGWQWPVMRPGPRHVLLRAAAAGLIR